MWAWIITEADGSEGVPAMSVELFGEKTMMPLMGADEARIRSLEPHARWIAEMKGLPLKLMRFSAAEVIE